MKSILKSIAAVAAILSVVAGILYGYVANIISLVTQTEPVGMMVGRAIGIFLAPIGVMLGYF